jgi:hypothetical protein
MDSLLFLGALVAVAWTVVWTIMNGAGSEAKLKANSASYNARARRKSQIPSQNPPPG